VTPLWEIEGDLLIVCDQRRQWWRGWSFDHDLSKSPLL